MELLIGLKNGNKIIGKVQIKNQLKIKIFGLNWIILVKNIRLLGNGLKLMRETNIIILPMS